MRRITGDLIPAFEETKVFHLSATCPQIGVRHILILPEIIIGIHIDIIIDSNILTTLWKIQGIGNGDCSGMVLNGVRSITTSVQVSGIVGSRHLCVLILGLFMWAFNCTCSFHMYSSYCLMYAYILYISFSALLVGVFIMTYFMIDI